MASAECRRYWTELVRDGCIITGRPAEIAHCHGGSIVMRMGEPKAKGRKLDRYDWLVLPLAPELHRLNENIALDIIGAWKWERLYGTQAAWIDYLAAKHERDLWALAAKEASQ